MSAPAWRLRAWRVALGVALLAATYGFLLPQAGADVEVLPHLDKLVHAGIFAALALLARPAYPDAPRWGAFAALVLYGAAVEFAQGRVPDRMPDALDLVADALGAAVVFLLPRRPAQAFSAE